MAPVDSAATAASAAFPSGLYGRYKRATQFFLDWLLHARSAGVGAASADSSSSKTSRKSKAKKKRSKPKSGVALDVYDAIVTAIASDPSTLTPAVEKLWTHALAACETAITLRMRVATFLSSKGDDRHAHFLGLLQSWLALLQTSRTSANVADSTKLSKRKTVMQAQMKEEKPKAVDFSNYYAVLELPEDYFSASADYTEPTSESTATKLSPAAMSAAQRQRMLDETFENDLNAELSFFFMELDELLEAVHDAFLDLKHQRCTLIEATAVTKLAVDSAASVIARLQLQYPAINSGYGLMTMIRDWMPPDEYQVLWDKVVAGWLPSTSQQQQQSVYPAYVPGSIIVDLMWVSNAFAGFIARLPPPELSHMSLSVPGEGPHFVPPYNEETTPEYLWPSMDPATPFFRKEFPVLYNILVRDRWSGAKQKDDTLEDWFLDIFDDAVSSRTATLQCIFLFVCWVRSVAVLQGDGGLTRTISLSIMHRLEIEERLRTSVSRGTLRRLSPDLHGHMKEVLGYFEYANKSTLAVRANPILAGCVMLDHHFTFQLFGSEPKYPVTHFRGFVHIYNAMLDLQLLDRIPFLDELMQVDEYPFFKPSREASVRGSFTRGFRVSSNLTVAVIDANEGRRAPLLKRKERVGMKDFVLPSISRLCRLVKFQDFTVLPVASSWRALLAAVIDLCSQELYESRLLARDNLTLKDHITDVLILLSDTLDRRPDNERLASAEGRGNQLEESLDGAVIMALLGFLDCLNVDGSISVTESKASALKLPVGLLRMMRESGEIEEFCRSAATVIGNFFAHLTPEEIEKRYFSLPRSPDWATIEFGDGPYFTRRARVSCSSQETWDALMQMMERSDGPLQGEQLEQFKDAVRQGPEVIVKGEKDSSKELCTLLHHVAAGPAHDRHLLEWLIGMGALDRECPMHRIPQSRENLAASGFDPKRILNMLAIHSAAKAGRVDSVCVLLEAGFLRDLDTRTLHTRETLLHLAVKHGHRDVADYLMRHYAEARTEDAEGRSVHSLTADVEWKRVLIQFAVDQQRQDDVLESSPCKVMPNIERESAMTAEQLRKSLAKQREEEQATHRRGMPRK